MSMSCTRHQQIPVSAERGTDKTFAKNFVLGLSISALIWASLAAGTRMTMSGPPATDEQARLSLVQ